MTELREIVKKEYIENDKTLCFQTTPLSKVILLGITSFGIYHIILAFSWWKSLKLNFGYKVSPFWRGFFSWIMNIHLFQIFEHYFKSLNIPGKSFSGASLGFVFLILAIADSKLAIKSLLWDLEGKLTPQKGLTISIISFLISLFLTWILAFMQKKINKTNEIYFAEAPKNPWKISNYIWLVICTILTVISLLPIE